MSMADIGTAFVAAEAARLAYEQACEDVRNGLSGSTSEPQHLAEATLTVARAAASDAVEAELARSYGSAYARKYATADEIEKDRRDGRHDEADGKMAANRALDQRRVKREAVQAKAKDAQKYLDERKKGR